MNESEFTNAFYTKLDDLEKEITDTPADRKAILKEIRKIKNWLISNPSVLQMKKYQALFGYVFNQVGDKFIGANGDPSRTAFVDYLKNACGHCTYTEVKKVKTDLTYDMRSVIDHEDIDEIVYDKIIEVCQAHDFLIYRTYHPASIAFGKCPQKKRNKFFNKCDDIIGRKFNIDVKEYFKQYEQNENTIQ